MMSHRNKKNIIISADDFGKSEKANRNILKLVEAGKIDRVAVMVEGKLNSEDVKKLLLAKVKLDIHFELIWQKRRRNLIADNTLKQGIVFLVNYLWGDWPVPENPRSGASSVKREWKSQVEKFKNIFGRTPDGMSSHEHTHYFPPYLKIALELARQHEIPFVRFGKKGFLGEKNSVNSILKIMRWFGKKKHIGSGIDTSEYFVSLDWIGNFREFLEDLPGGKTEISCHPEREEEYNLLNKIQ